MRPEKAFPYGLTIALSGTLIVNTALAQPTTTPENQPNATAPLVPPLTPDDLEKIIGGRTTLTLDLKNATLEEAAKALNDATGLNIAQQDRPVFARPAINEVQMPTPPEPRYDFEATGQPFWEAFLSWQRAAIAAWKPSLPPTGLAPASVPAYRYPNADLGLFGFQKTSSGLSLVPANPLVEGRTLVSWPFVMVGTQLTRTQQGNLDETGLSPVIETPMRRTPFADSPRQMAPMTPQEPAKPIPTEAERWRDYLLFNVQTYIDPKVKASNISCEVEEAVDDKGNDLRATNNLLPMPTAFMLNRGLVTNGPMAAVTIPLRSKPAMGTKLVRLRGTLRFTVVSNSKHWETTDLTTPTAGTSWRDGTEFAIKFNGLTQTPDGVDLSFTATSEGQRLRQLWEQWHPEANRLGRDDIGIFRGPNFRVQIVDDKGQVFPWSAGSWRATLGKKGDPKAMVPVRPGDSPLPIDLSAMVYTETVGSDSSSMPPLASSFAGRGVTSRGPGIGADPSRGTMGRAVKLIVDIPLERREVALPFEFTDLPLPPS